jgi:hypothetical protein
LFEGCDGVFAGDLLSRAWNLQRAQCFNQQPDSLHVQRDSAIGLDPELQHTGHQRACREVRRSVAISQQHQVGAHQLAPRGWRFRMQLLEIVDRIAVA